MDDQYALRTRPTAAHPLKGVTLLVVEDSRYASDAIRMLCQRSGARVRRADSLDHARRHLRVYRPTIAIIDMGLPDGDGEELIRDLASAGPAIRGIVAISGDPFASDRAIKAGAHVFLEKPIDSLAAFQAEIIALLPPEMTITGPRIVDTSEVVPDPLALAEDLRHAEAILSVGAPQGAAYAADFLSGIARTTGDHPLLEAAQALAGSAGENAKENSRLRTIIRERLSDVPPI